MLLALPLAMLLFWVKKKMDAELFFDGTRHLKKTTIKLINGHKSPIKEFKNAINNLKELNKRIKQDSQKSNKKGSLKLPFVILGDDIAHIIRY